MLNCQNHILWKIIFSNLYIKVNKTNWIYMYSRSNIYFNVSREWKWRTDKTYMEMIPTLEHLLPATRLYILIIMFLLGKCVRSIEYSNFPLQTTYIYQTSWRTNLIDLASVIPSCFQLGLLVYFAASENADPKCGRRS